jgi:hypothetical protein
MKLKELLDEIFKDGPLKENEINENINARLLGDYTLYGEEMLSRYNEKLLQCEELSEVTEMEFMSTPIISVDGKPLMAQSLKINDGTKIKGKCYLLSIMYTPEMYDPKSINEPVKDGACITPTLYNPQTFEPNKKIVLSFSPERPANEMASEELLRQELHDLLDKVLDSPEEYKVKGIRGILIRGVFETIDNGLEPKVENLTGFVNKQDDNPDHFLLFYLKKIINGDSTISLKLEQKVLPIEKKELYLERFKDNVTPTEEEINKFLEENEIYGN